MRNGQTLSATSLSMLLSRVNKGRALEYSSVAVRRECLSAEFENDEPQAEISKIIAVIRRRFPLAIIGALVGSIMATTFLLLAQPSYMSSIRILLDQDRSKLLTEISGEIAPSSTDEYIATQLAVAESDIVARRVVNDLKLTYDHETKRLRLSDQVPPETAALPRANAVSAEDLVKLNIDPNVVDAVQKSVKVYQVEKSFVLEIGASDPDPVVAQQIARSYGLAYLTDQLSARFEATRNAGSWLEGRIDTLRDQSLEASAAVEEFRKDNNLVSTDGRLVSDQQLSGLNVELGNAKATVTRTAARVSVFDEAVRRGDAETILGIAASASDIPEAAPIRALRSDYLQASERQREIAARWGEQNDQSQALKAEVARLSSLVLDEAQRILRGYRNDFEVAKSEADSISASVMTATARSQIDNSLQVQLRGLEQRAASYNALYQDYLARYQEAVQQQTLSLTTGRLISQPELPVNPLYPNKKIILALSLFLGICIGGGIGVIQEVMNSNFHARSDVEAAGVSFLGYVLRQRKSSGRAVRASGANPELAATNRYQGVCDAIRIAFNIRCRGRGRTVGVISLRPSRERSLLALGYARAEAASGLRVLLIDGDNQEGALSKLLSDGPGSTLQDVLLSSSSFDEAVVNIERNLYFLPTSIGAGLITALNHASSDRLPAWQASFDLVIVDLSQASPISETRALASWFDALLCTVDWGVVPKLLLRKLVRSSVDIQNKISGVVVTDVPLRKLKLYDRQAALDLARQADAS